MLAWSALCAPLRACAAVGWGWGPCSALWGAPALDPPADRVQTLGAGLSTKMTSGHPPLPPALVLARHLGWPGGQASAAVSGQRAGVQWGLKGGKRSGPGTPRRPERTGRELSRALHHHGPAPEHQCHREHVRAHLPLELGKLRPEGGRDVPRVTQHPRAPSSPAVRPSLGSCSLGEDSASLPPRRSLQGRNEDRDSGSTQFTSIKSS